MPTADQMLGPEEEAPKAAPVPSVPSVPAPVAAPATAPAAPAAPAAPVALPAFSGRDLSMVPEEEADYEMVSPRQMFADTSNLIPGAFSMKGARLMISGKYFSIYKKTPVIIKRRGGEGLVLNIEDYQFQDGDASPSVDPETGQVVWLPVQGVSAHRFTGRMARIRLKSGREVEVTEHHSCVTMGPDGSIVECFPEDMEAGTPVPRARSLPDLPDGFDAERILGAQLPDPDDAPASSRTGDSVAWDRVESIEWRDAEDETVYDLHMADNLFMAGQGIFVHNTQALPLAEQEAPLVDSLDEATGEGMGRSLGSRLGLRRARAAGTVTNVGNGFVEIKGEDGRKFREELHAYFPSQRKTFTNDSPLVKVGDRVEAGQPVARSNYVTPEGDLALGRNLRVAFMAGPGGSTFEDAIAISESAAKKLSSTHLYGFGVEHRNGTQSRKDKFVQLFPKRFTKEQLDKLDDDGMARPGARIEPGDPVALAFRPMALSTRDAALGNLSKVLRNSHLDETQVWEKSVPGSVADAVRTKNGIRVNVVAKVPAKVGDKLSARQGAKGVIGSVQSDSVMPVDKDGNPVEIVINPAALIGRVNPAMVFEALLGKVARRTGTRAVMEDRIGESTLEHVREQLAKHGVEANEPLTDPVSGRTIGNIMTGEQYFLKLEHMSEDKVGHRAEGAHDIDGQPAKGGKEGAKRLGGLINTALQGHGATEVLRDAHVYRGVDDPEVWRAIRSGRPLPPAKVPFAYRKFLNLMRGAGIAIRETPDRVSATAMTDRDVEALGAREVMSGETIDDRTGEPVEGGLFDHGIFGGPEQTGWGKITLDEPVPNPIMENSVRALLGITGTKLRNVVAGKDSLGGSTGPSAVLKALEGIDLDRARAEALEAVRSFRGTRRNEAVKRLRAVQGLRNAGLEARDLMVTAIPVLPPAFRPAAKMGDVTIVSDSNYLYKDLLGARDAFRASRSILPDSELQDERLAVYDAVRAVQGVGAPIHQETRDKGVKGFMDMLTGAGKGPKMGYAQRKVFGHPVNAVGRAAIVPDARLDMDQVGIPEKMAWTSFEPFAMGLMVRDGMDARQAARELADRTPTARRFLLEAMKERPVMVSRDPALHKFSIMGAEPVLVQGSAMRISPLVVGPYAADHDGDQMNMHIPVSSEAIREIREKMMPSKNLFSISGRKIHYKPSQEFVLGIYNSSKPNPKKLRDGAPRRFGSMEEVLAAYRDKEIDIDTPVEIVQAGQATGSEA